MSGFSIALLVMIIFTALVGTAYMLLASDVIDTNVSKSASMSTTEAERVAAELRKKHIQAAIKKFEAQRAGTIDPSNPPLFMRLEQSGLGWSLSNYLIISCGAVFVCILGVYFAGLPLLLAIPSGGLVGLFLPYWFVNRSRNKRKLAFLNGLPEALDAIVRGVRAGLPVAECVRTVSLEAEEPLRSVFRRVVDLQRFGLSFSMACSKMYSDIPTTEVNLFTVAVSVQQSTGGNLCEILSNLTDVMRSRKRMQNKIEVVSQESKSSAMIIGSLPVVISVLLSYLNPSYLLPLVHTDTGNMLLALCVILLICGTLVMRKMTDIEV